MTNKFLNEKEMKLIKQCENLEKELPNGLDEYFTFLKNTKSVKTRNDYLREIRNMFKDLEIKTMDDIININPKIINDYIVNLNLSNSTKSKKLATLKSLYIVLYNKDIIDKDITNKFDKITVQAKQEDDIDMLEQDEVDRLYILLNNNTYHGYANPEAIRYRNKILFKMAITYGLRISEIQQLNFSNFNLTNKEVCGIIRKRGKKTSFPLTDELVSLISEYKALRKDDNDALFISRSNTRLSTQSLNEISKMFTRRITSDGRELNFHKLRSTCASLMLEKGVDIYQIKSWLDHSSVETTQLYARNKKDFKNSIISKLN